MTDATSDARREPSFALARELIARHRLTEIPARLDRLFADLDIQGVKKVDSPGWSGLLQRGADGFIILLNQDEARTRRRFSCAHEIAHLIVARATGHPLSIDNRDALPERTACDAALERLCDEIACTLVVPPSIAREWAARVVSLEQLCLLASHASVSPDVAALATFPLGQQRACYVRWYHGGRRGSDERTWRAKTSVATPVNGWFYPRFKSAPPDLCEQFARHPRGTTRLFLDIEPRATDARVEFQARALRGERFIISIITPASSPSHDELTRASDTRGTREPLGGGVTRRITRRMTRMCRVDADLNHNCRSASRA